MECRVVRRSGHPRVPRWAGVAGVYFAIHALAQHFIRSAAHLHARRYRHHRARDHSRTRRLRPRGGVAHIYALAAAKRAGVSHTICVQKPLLALQRAKLAFEEVLMHSGLTWSIVRPTAFFKSLSGQVSRVKGGKPFLVFGDGMLTACKPISDDDLAAFIAACLDDPTSSSARRSRVADMFPGHVPSSDTGRCR